MADIKPLTDEELGLWQARAKTGYMEGLTILEKRLLASIDQLKASLRELCDGWDQEEEDGIQWTSRRLFTDEVRKLLGESKEEDEK